MRRSLLSLTLGATLLAGIPAQAFWQSRDSNYNVSISTGASYTGPGDVVSGATAWYGLRAYSAAYAATPGLSVNLRRASDNVACDVNVATSGGLGLTTATCNSSTQGGITPTAFAGTDATATCTLSTTTATCASASSTPHVGSTITGAGLTQPCLITAVGTFTGGAGTLTTSLAGTSTSCGTISVGETFTMTYGLFVTEAYDQSGSLACSGSVACNATQAVAGSQLQLLPACINATLPCFYSISASNTQLNVATGFPTTALPWTFSWVGLRAAVAEGLVVALGTGSGRAGPFTEFTSSANTIGACDGNGSCATGTGADGILHAVQAIVNGATVSAIVIDGTATSGSTGTSAAASRLVYGGGIGGVTANIYQTEGGAWALVFNSTQYGNSCHNQRLYYGMPGSC